MNQSPRSHINQRRWPRQPWRLALASAAALVVSLSAGPMATQPAAASSPAPPTPASLGRAAAPNTTMHISASAAAADLCAQVGAAAGFPKDNRLVTAVAVGLAESGCNPSAQGPNGPTAGCPNGSCSDSASRRGNPR